MMCPCMFVPVCVECCRAPAEGAQKPKCTYTILYTNVTMIISAYRHNDIHRYSLLLCRHIGLSAYRLSDIHRYSPPSPVTHRYIDPPPLRALFSDRRTGVTAYGRVGCGGEISSYFLGGMGRGRGGGYRISAYPHVGAWGGVGGISAHRRGGDMGYRHRRKSIFVTWCMHVGNVATGCRWTKQ